jgi:Na+/melibiose symporter-like transporter
MPIAKALLAVVVSAVGALVTALGTSPQQSFSTLSTTQWLVAVGSVLGSGGVVWFVENGPAHAYIKTVVAFLSAGIASLVVALGDGVISQAEWLTAFGAAVVTTGFVFQIKNAPATP